MPAEPVAALPVEDNQVAGGRRCTSDVGLQNVVRIETFLIGKEDFFLLVEAIGERDCSAARRVGHQVKAAYAGGRRDILRVDFRVRLRQ